MCVAVAMSVWCCHAEYSGNIMLLLHHSALQPRARSSRLCNVFPADDDDAMIHGIANFARKQEGKVADDTTASAVVHTTASAGVRSCV